jgi:hypothetical protein
MSYVECFDEKTNEWFVCLWVQNIVANYAGFFKQKIQF